MVFTFEFFQMLGVSRGQVKDLQTAPSVWSFWTHEAQTARIQVDQKWNGNHIAALSVCCLQHRSSLASRLSTSDQEHEVLRLWLSIVTVLGKWLSGGHLHVLRLSFLSVIYFSRKLRALTFKIWSH